MTVPFPIPQWPLGLLEVGPEQDPSIFLRSIADIAGASYELLAIRIDPITMGVDLREDVPARAYRALPMAAILDEISAFAEISEQSLVLLSTGHYVMIMLPTLAV